VDASDGIGRLPDPRQRTKPFRRRSVVVANANAPGGRHLDRAVPYVETPEIADGLMHSEQRSEFAARDKRSSTLHPTMDNAFG
jgi:hypothetical protein